MSENTYIAFISHGKDSNAMLHVIKNILHKPLDRIISTSMWATETLEAEFPEMVEWRKEADKRIYDMFGVPVEYVFATDKDGNKLTYDGMFHSIPTRTKYPGMIKGFPLCIGSWCRKLKYEKVDIDSYLDRTCRGGL